MIVLVDGRSGSGKTELARAIVALHPSFQLVRLDDLYPGWDGLDAGSAAVPELLRTGTWRSWDWAADGPGEWRAIDPAGDILVEGVGALTRESRGAADRAVWVELDALTRRERALARDEYFAEHWDAWAREEDALLAREHPWTLADVVVDGAEPADVSAERLALRP